MFVNGDLNDCLQRIVFKSVQGNLFKEIVFKSVFNVVFSGYYFQTCFQMWEKVFNDIWNNGLPRIVFKKYSKKVIQEKPKEIVFLFKDLLKEINTINAFLKEFLKDEND